MAEMIKFYKGALANLPQSGVNGAIYVTSDEGAIYLGTGTGMKRLGDFIQVDAVANLPVDGANPSALYYGVAENILCRFDKDSGEWTQINRQKTLAQLGGVSLEAYNTKMAALEQADTANSDAIAGVDTRLKAAEKKLESVATTEGLGELTERVTAAEGDIDGLQAAIAEGGSVANAIADAKKAGTDAAEAAQSAKDIAESKVTMAEVEAKNYATKTEAQGYADAKDEAIQTAQAGVDALTGKVGTVPEGKTVVGMIAEAQEAATYDDEEVRGLIGANADAIDALEGTHATDKKTLEDAIALKADKTTVEGIDGRVTAVEGDVATIKGDYLKSSDKTELQGNIDTVAGAVERLTNGVSADEIDGVNDLINYVNTHGTEVTGMKEDIQANTDAIAAIEADYLKAADKTALQGSIDGVAGRMTTAEGEIDALQADSHTHANSAELAKIVDGDVAKWNAAQANAEATAAAALAAAKTELEGKITAEAERADAAEKANASAIDAVEGRLDTLEAIDHEAYKTADETVLAEAKSYADGKDAAMGARVKAIEDDYLKAADKAALTEAIGTNTDAIAANAAEIAKKADASSVYTQEEVDAAIEEALVEAFQWGSF